MLLLLRPAMHELWQHAACACVRPQDDAKEAEWFPISSLPTLAFDHKLVVRSSLRHLAGLAPAQAVGE